MIEKISSQETTPKKWQHTEDMGNLPRTWQWEDIPYSMRAPKTNRIQASIQASIAVRPSAFGAKIVKRIYPYVKHMYVFHTW